MGREIPCQSLCFKLRLSNDNQENFHKPVPFNVNHYIAIFLEQIFKRGLTNERLLVCLPLTAKFRHCPIALQSHKSNFI